MMFIENDIISELTHLRHLMIEKVCFCTVLDPEISELVDGGSAIDVFSTVGVSHLFEYHLHLGK